MPNFVYTFQLQQFAANYGHGNYNSDVYSAKEAANTDTTQGATPGTTVPGAPNTGLFGGAIPGISEASLIPLLLIVAVVIGVATVAIRKLVKKHRA